MVLPAPGASGTQLPLSVRSEPISTAIQATRPRVNAKAYVGRGDPPQERINFSLLLSPLFFIIREMEPAFRRTRQRPSSTETMVGILILAVLAAVGAGVLHSQQTFHPPVQLSRSLHESPQRKDPQGDPSATVPGLIQSPPSGIDLVGKTEAFSPTTLSQKIDGKAELYLSAGFQGLRTQRFAPEGERSWWAELFAYDMGGSANAFSVFSTQQRDTGRPADLARHAYHTENALFFIHGPYYVEAVASTASDAVRQDLSKMARRFMEENPVRTEATASEIPSLFPEQGLIERSIERIAADAFGFDRLDNVYTARYLTAGGEQTLFLSRRTSPDEAAALADAYIEFLLQFGGKRLRPEAEGGRHGDVVIVEILGAFEAVFSHGRHLAGVHEAPSADAAAELAERLERRLEKGPS